MKGGIKPLVTIYLINFKVICNGDVILRTLFQWINTLKNSASSVFWHWLWCNVPCNVGGEAWSVGNFSRVRKYKYNPCQQQQTHCTGRGTEVSSGNLSRVTSFYLVFFPRHIQWKNYTCFILYFTSIVLLLLFFQGFSFTRHRLSGSVEYVAEFTFNFSCYSVVSRPTFTFTLFTRIKFLPFTVSWITSLLFSENLKLHN